MNPSSNTASLSKGANVNLSVNLLHLHLTWSGGEGVPDVDISALLLQEDGKVESDAEFIFYNQPGHGSNSVSHEGKSATGNGFKDALKVDLSKVPNSVDRIVVAGSADGGTFGAVPELNLTVLDANGNRGVVQFSITDAANETAFIFGELYRRNDVWKFRAVGQGYDNGLSGLAKDFGIDVDEEGQNEPAAISSPPPGGARPGEPLPKADWYSDPEDKTALRWWTGSSWSNETIPSRWPGEGACQRCGSLPRGTMPSGPEASCSVCDAQISSFMRSWQGRATEVLNGQGPGSAEWDKLWVELRHERIDRKAGISAVRAPALGYLERYVAFAFADGEIEEDEMVAFEAAVTAVGITDTSIVALKNRMEKGRTLTEVRSGKLPSLTSTSLQLDSDEILHLDETITYIKVLASGPKDVPGRFIATNKKLRFVAPTGGWELSWAKIISAESEYDRLVMSSTAAKGGGEYKVENSELIAATLVGIMRVAKRLVLAPGQRDTRSIPQAMRTAVWQRDGGKCVECQAAEYLEFDHVIPHSKGGATSIQNLQLLCRKCNQEKGARI